MELLEAKLDLIFEQLKELNHMVGAVRFRQDEMDAKLDGMDAKFDEVDMKLKGMDTKLKEMDNRLEMMDNKLIMMDGRLNSVHDEVVSIKETMATKYDLKYYDLKIGELEREIFKMKQD